MTAVALTSGVERDVLQASLDTSKSQVEACGRMTISAEGAIDNGYHREGGRHRLRTRNGEFQDRYGLP